MSLFLKKISQYLLSVTFLLILLTSCEGLKPTNRSQTLIDEKKQPKQQKATPVKMIVPYSKKGNNQLTTNLKNYCEKIDKKFYQYGWGKSGCNRYNWHHVRSSYWGNPIAWVTYGVPEKIKANTTIIFCGVHPDEITPIKFCYDVMRYLNKNIKKYSNTRVVVAPVVAPDSFFKKYPTRTNARGVDVNRNFPTRDWDENALQMWRHRYGKSKRRFPGKIPKSEQEVHFQINLINRYNPSKIISVHAPLTILDYDGPENHGDVQGAKELLIQMSKNAKGYKIKNYPFFPGSLGNWAGNERGIPTYTLELPTSDNRDHKKHWELFRKAIGLAIGHQLATVRK